MEILPTLANLPSRHTWPAQLEQAFEAACGLSYLLVPSALHIGTSGPHLQVLSPDLPLLGYPQADSGRQ